MIQGVPTISVGNIKLGRIHNINLPPPIVCKGKPCLKNGCYAMKAYRLHPSVRQSWNNNFYSFKKSPSKYFSDIIRLIKGKRIPVTHFRWHSAGEIPNQTYLNGMFRVAEAFPSIKFLVFTKRYFLNFEGCPSNLQVLFSTWPKMKLPSFIREKSCIAWMDDGDYSHD